MTIKLTILRNCSCLHISFGPRAPFLCERPANSPQSTARACGSGLPARSKGQAAGYHLDERYLKLIDDRLISIRVDCSSSSSPLHSPHTHNEHLKALRCQGQGRACHRWWSWYRRDGGSHESPLWLEKLTIDASQIASGYVANGAKVYIASRSLKACKETADKLNAQGPGKCIPLAADLQKYEDCVRLAKEIGEKEDRLDVLVNNSGANWGQEIDSYPDEAFTKVMTLNVQRVFTLTQKLLPLLRKSAAKGHGQPARVIMVGAKPLPTRVTH